MKYCYRYWAWTTDIQANELQLMRDLRLWNCEIERQSESISIWVPESANLLFQLKYPNIRAYPVFDRY